MADDYDCPICHGLNGGDGPPVLIHDSDVAGRNELAVAAVRSHFLPGNVAQAVALAMKRRYDAAGISHTSGMRTRSRLGSQFQSRAGFWLPGGSAPAGASGRLLRASSRRVPTAVSSGRASRWI